MPFNRFNGFNSVDVFGFSRKKKSLAALGAAIAEHEKLNNSAPTSNICLFKRYTPFLERRAQRAGETTL